VFLLLGSSPASLGEVCSFLFFEHSKDHRLRLAVRVSQYKKPLSTLQAYDLQDELIANFFSDIWHDGSVSCFLISERI
jgi:hypothetical protein